MTTALDTKMAAKVVDVLAKYGTSVSLIIESRDYDPATGLNTIDDGGTQVIKASPPDKYNQFLVATGTVRAEDFRTVIAATGLNNNPKTGDKVLWDSKTYTIMNATPLSATDDVVAFELHLRYNG